MTDRLLTFGLAFALGLFVWLYARSREREILDNIVVPVTVRLAPGLADSYRLESPAVGQVRVSFTGPPNKLRELQEAISRIELSATVDYALPEDQLERNRIEDSVRVEATDLRVPAGVTVLPVEGRNRIGVMLSRLGDKVVKVRIETSKDLEPRLRIIPETVKVRAPRDLLERLFELSVILPSRDELGFMGLTPGRPARLPLPREVDGIAIVPDPESVVVRIDPQAPRIYPLADLPVQFLCPPNFTLRPRFLDDRAGKLQLRIQGPDQGDTPRVHAYIDLTGGRFLPGPGIESVQIQLPRDFTLAQDPPAKVSFELVPVEAAPKPLGGLPAP
jgi:hypothetical protein